jgi:predicted ATP-dependent serine protease
LEPPEPPEWVLEGYIAKGYCTLLSAIWKVGKTTFMAWMLHDLIHGGGLVPTPTRRRTLVISEEGSGHWSRRREAFKLDDHVHVLCRPFRGRPSLPEWERFIAHVCDLIQLHGYDLVVIDTLAGLWSVADENDAAHVTAALMPLNAITGAGVALLLIHHLRKGDGTEGQASRGSGALPSFVDVVVEMRRNDGKADDARRVLTAYSRFDDTPVQNVLELSAGGYQVLGNRSEVGKGDRFRTIGHILASAPQPLTPEEVLKHWPEGAKPSLRSVEADLAEGFREKRWVRIGEGVRNDPYRYAANGFDSRKGDSIGARIESRPSLAPESGGAA